MRRTTTIGAAGLLGLALLTPFTSASAAGETCRGEAATIVGTGPTLTGTEGRDVVVTGSATTVTTLGGDDLVCVTGAGQQLPASVSTDPGAGNDVVDATTVPAGSFVRTVLGDGADTYDGGEATDVVTATTDVDRAQYDDPSVDTVRTGGGSDTVFRAGGVDVVDLGAGDDRFEEFDFNTRPGSSIDGGDGIDVLATFVGENYGFDMLEGYFATSAKDYDSRMEFSSFEGIDVDASWGADFGYRGTDGPDRVSVTTDGPFTAYVEIVTAGGDDEVTLDIGSPASGINGGVDGVYVDPNLGIDTGTGTDRLDVRLEDGSVDVDLEGELLAAGRGEVLLTGVEDAFVSANHVTMRGDAADNDLQANACRAVLSGGSGDDRLTHVAGDTRFEDTDLACGEPRTTVLSGGRGADDLTAGGGRARVDGGAGPDRIRTGGGDDRVSGGAGRDRIDTYGGRDHVRGDGGADVIRGGTGRDVLRGGRGNDTADGGKGRDRCDAETEKRCEL